MTTPIDEVGRAKLIGQRGSADRGQTQACLSGADEPKRWHHSLLLFLLGALWGLQFTLLKIAADAELDELSILTIAMFLLALAFLAAMACRRAWFRPTLGHIWFFLISALFGFVVPLSGVILVAEQLSAGLIVFFESLTPVLTVAIVALLGTERLKLPRLLAVALGMIGVLLVLWPNIVRPGSARLESMLIALVIPLAYAIDGVYVAARWPSDLRAFQVVTGEAVAAATMLLPFLLWQTLAAPAQLAYLTDPWFIETWGWGHWAVLAFVPVSFLEAYLYFYLLKHAGAVFVSFGSFISLFAGIFWGLVLLGERHSVLVWIAVLLVSFSLYLVNYGAFRQDRTKAPVQHKTAIPATPD
ncbi:DMT family transporter [Pelagibius sp. Alg239-R121]|uniref:DMT family transporter n=1 Tax=Pelagibius sp. Alg239-R121 TaxID=2993448 RepID=UPI0024A77676|nr:DMT family transporter [Pelagibius sp. Alg239-R121]